jgi:hypothetical protein
VNARRLSLAAASVAVSLLAVGLMWQAHRPVLPVIVSPVDLDAQPTGWVPFSATVRVIGETGGVTRGRFHRDRNGSTRREGVGEDGSLRFVDIVNIAEGRFYVRSGTDRWSVQRMEPLPATYPSPAVIGPHQIVLSDTVEGLTVLREKTADGAVLLRAPALNGFAVVEEHPDDGVRIEYSEIQVRHPDPRLFRPPDDVEVIRLPWPHEGARPR